MRRGLQGAEVSGKRSLPNFQWVLHVGDFGNYYFLVLLFWIMHPFTLVYMGNREIVYYLFLFLLYLYFFKKEKVDLFHSVMNTGIPNACHLLSSWLETYSVWCWRDCWRRMVLPLYCFIIVGTFMFLARLLASLISVQEICLMAFNWSLSYLWRHISFMSLRFHT